MSRKVLIAEDDIGFRFPIANFLSDFNFEVIEAENYTEALNKAKLADIWIIDIRLPTKKLEGILVVKELAEQGIRSNYPVFFISVLPESLAENELAYLKDHGIPYVYIEKPFETELLVRRIAEAESQA